MYHVCVDILFSNTVTCSQIYHIIYEQIYPFLNTCSDVCHECVDIPVFKHILRGLSHRCRHPRFKRCSNMHHVCVDMAVVKPILTHNCRSRRKNKQPEDNRMCMKIVHTFNNKTIPKCFHVKDFKQLIRNVTHTCYMFLEAHLHPHPPQKKREKRRKFMNAEILTVHHRQLKKGLWQEQC